MDNLQLIKDYLKSLEAPAELGKIRLKVLGKAENGYKLGYAINGGLPRNGDNIAKLCSIEWDGELKPGVAVEITAKCVNPVFTGEVCGLHLSGGEIQSSLGFKSPDTTAEILEKAISFGVCECDDEDFVKLKKRGLVKTAAKEVTFHKSVKIIKDSKKQIVYGVVYEPFDGSNIDFQGDYMTDAEIEKMAHGYLEDGNNINIMHQGSARGAVSTVESYIAPADFSVGDEQIKKGSWVKVDHIKDADLWSKIESGELDAYSIEGTGNQGVALV